MRCSASRLTISGAAVATESTTVINACYNNENGLTRIVENDADCRAAETAISWNQTGPQGPAGPAGPAGAGVTTVSGIVNANGTANGATPNGFTSTRLAEGVYRVSFPPGTWSSFPVMTVSPFGVLGAYGTPNVISAIGFGDGSAQVDIHMVNGQTLFDNAFMFQATASVGAP